MVKVAKSAGLGVSDLVVVRFGVLHRLQADGHDSERWRRQVFDDGDQVRLQGQSLHLTPADRLAQALWQEETGSSMNIVPLKTKIKQRSEQRFSYVASWCRASTGLWSSCWGAGAPGRTCWSQICEKTSRPSGLRAAQETQPAENNSFITFPTQPHGMFVTCLLTEYLTSRYSQWLGTSGISKA